MTRRTFRYTVEPALVRQKSRDFFWYSPVLNRQLRGCSAQAVVSPRDEADVVRVAAACFGTGCRSPRAAAARGITDRRCRCKAVIVLDMTALDAIEWQRPGMLRVGPAAS